MKLNGFLIFVLAVTLSACGTNSPEGVDATTGQPEEPAVADPLSTPAARLDENRAAPSSPGPAPSRAPSPAPAVVPSTPTPPPAPRLVEIPAGTSLEVILIDAISTARNQPGDPFTGTLAAAVMVDGATVLRSGTKVEGRITDLERSGRVSGRANLRMVLTSIVDGGKSYPIVTRPLVAEAEGTRGRDAAIIGGAAGVGAAIGGIAGGGKGAATGAAIGGGAGTGTVLVTRGSEVEFDSESRLQFTLDRGVEVPRG